MKSSSSSLRPLLPAALLIFAAAAVTGWKIAMHSYGSASPAGPAPASSSLPARLLTGKRQPSGDAQSAMELIRQSRDPGERMQGTIALAHSIPVSSFAMWFKAGWFNVHEGPEMTIFTKIIMQRWKKEDPDGYLDWTLSSNAPEASTELSAMMASDPEKALAALKKHPDVSTETRALIDLAKTHPEMAIEALRDFATRNPSEGYAGNFHDLFQEMAAKDPAALEALIPSFTSNYRDQMTAALWEGKLNSSFTESLQRLWERPDGMRIFLTAMNDSDKVGPDFVKQLGNMPPDWVAAIGNSYYRLIGSRNAEAWLQADLSGAGMDPYQIKSIRDTAIQHLSLSQPEKALKLLDGAEVSEEARKDNYFQIFAACRNDPDRQKELVAMIDSEAGRAAAAKVLEQMEENQKNARAAAETNEPITPANILGKLAGPGIQGVNTSDYMQAVASWDDVQMRAATSQFASLPEEQKAAASKALVSLIQGYDDVPSSDLANQAIVYALGHPDTAAPEISTRIGMRGGMDRMVSNYAIKWGDQDPDAASAWVMTLPESDTRTWAIKNLARNWNRYDPQAVSQFIDKLPAGQQEPVRQYLNSRN